MIAVLVVLLLATVASGADVLIEDWKGYKAGTTGLPGDWKAQNWGSPNYDNIKIVERPENDSMRGAGAKVPHLLRIIE